VVVADETARLRYEVSRLAAVIEEKNRLWDDRAGHEIMARYLRPHAAAAGILVDTLEERDEVLTELLSDVDRAHAELEVGAASAAAGRSAIDDLWVALADLERTVEELTDAERRAAELEREAIRLADLANSYSGHGTGDVPRLEPLTQEAWNDERRAQQEIRRDQRKAELTRLQQAFPDLGVAHIVEGEINPKGKFVGFHSRGGGLGIVLHAGVPDAAGVYRAWVAADEACGLKYKTAANHTMFPDSWREDEICDEIMTAFSTVRVGVAVQGRWRGVGRRGLTVSGRICDDGSIIGHPKMEK